jgi:hypothetical protein
VQVCMTLKGLTTDVTGLLRMTLIIQKGGDAYGKVPKRIAPEMPYFVVRGPGLVQYHIRNEASRESLRGLTGSPRGSEQCLARAKEPLSFVIARSAATKQSRHGQPEMRQA